MANLVTANSAIPGKMDTFTPFNGQPASNGSGSQGEGGSQGGMPTMAPNGQGAGDNGNNFQGGDASRQTLW